MKKAIVVVIINAIVLGLVYSVLALLAYIGNPLTLHKKLDEQQFDTSFTLHNVSQKTISIKNIELGANASIELRSLSNTLFVRWLGDIKKGGLTLQPQTKLKLENSIYGKYSIPINNTSWNQLITAPIAQKTCNQYTLEWFHSMPERGLFLTVRDEDDGNFYQNAHYTVTQNSINLTVELEENFRRYSSRGSGFYYRYHCQTSGQHDRLSLFLDIIDQLTK